MGTLQFSHDVLTIGDNRHIAAQSRLEPRTHGHRHRLREVHPEQRPRRHPARRPRRSRSPRSTSGTTSAPRTRSRTAPASRTSSSTSCSRARRTTTSEYFVPLQEVGANINGSTSTDRTNYYENVPAEYLELALWLESDRMGFLLDAARPAPLRRRSATWSRTSAARATRTAPTASPGRRSARRSSRRTTPTTGRRSARRST